MLARRAAGGTDAEIKRAGRERAKVLALARRLADELTSGARLREQAFEAIYVKAWAARRKGQDVDQVAAKAAKAWRSRQDIENRKRRELTGSAKSIADRAARAAGQTYGPRAKKAVTELAYRGAYMTARRVIKGGGTDHEAYIAARRAAKDVHTS